MSGRRPLQCLWVRLVACLVASVLASSVFAGPVTNQEDWVRVTVTVTAVAGRSVYLDQGRDAGLQPGDTVRLSPFGGSVLVGTVRSVARSSSRAIFEDDLEIVEIGVEGEVLVPEDRAAPGDDDGGDPGDAGDGDAPDAGAADVVTGPGPSGASQAPPPRRVVPRHPTWTVVPGVWDQSLPLLAPAHSVLPAERERRVRGRWFGQASISRDNGSPGNRYGLYRTGLEMTVENPFAKGGTLDLDVEAFRRQASRGNGPDERTTRLRPDRVSYRWGGDREHPARWQVGRFLQHEFPELGVLDGAEYGRRLDSGDRLGASFGWLPSPRGDFASGNDLATSVFYRWVADEDETLTVGSALQKTWHRGTADRDLLLETVHYRANDAFSFHGTAWIDHYTGADQLKSSSFELTQLQLNGRFDDGDGDGLGLSLTSLRWPQLLRGDFDQLSASQIADNHVTRVSLNGWQRVSAHVRLSGRVSGWTDQSGSGDSQDVRLTLRDVLYDEGTVSLGVFQTRGRFSRGLGVRTRATRRLGSTSVSLGWDLATYDQVSNLGANQQAVQQTLRAGIDTHMGDGWDLSWNAASRMGDGPDTLTLDLMVQHRF